MHHDSLLDASSRRTFVIQVTVSACLGLALLIAADANSILQISARSSSSVFFITLALLTLKFGLTTWSTASAFRLHWLQLPPFLTTRALGGAFWANSILPTFAADFSRALEAKFEDDLARRHARASLAIERVLGPFFLLILGGLGALTIAEQFFAARVYLWMLSLATIALCVTSLIAISRDGLLDRWRRLPFIDALLENEWLLGKRGGHWGAVLIGSLLAQLLSVATVFALFTAVSKTTTLAQCAIIAAATGIATLLPVGYRAVGIMETAMVAVAVALGVNFTEAVLVATTHRVLSLLVSGGSVVFAEQASIQSAAAPPAARAAEAQPVDAPSHAAVPLAVEPPAYSHSRPLPSAELLEFTHDAIIIWEMDGGGILYWNQAAEQLYGYTREQAYGQTTHKLLKTQLFGGTEELEAKIARYGVWVGQLKHVTRDGRSVQVEGRLALMSQRDGKWLVLEVNRDITDLVKAQIAQEAAERQLASLHERAD